MSDAQAADLPGPELASRLIGLTGFYLRVGKLEEAERALGLAGIVREDSLRQRMAWGRLALERGQPRRALREYQGAVELDPFDDELRDQVGELHQELGDPFSAAQAWLVAKVLAGSIDEEGAEAYQEQAENALISVGREGELEPELARATQEIEDYAEDVLDNSGSASANEEIVETQLVGLSNFCMRSGQLDDAERHLARAQELVDGTQAQALAVSRLALLRGDAERARAALEDAAEKDPFSDEVRDLLGELLEALSQPRRAAEVQADALILAGRLDAEDRRERVARLDELVAATKPEGDLVAARDELLDERVEMQASLARRAEDEADAMAKTCGIDEFETLGPADDPSPRGEAPPASGVFTPTPGPPPAAAAEPPSLAGPASQAGPASHAGPASQAGPPSQAGTTPTIEPAPPQGAASAADRPQDGPSWMGPASHALRGVGVFQALKEADLELLENAIERQSLVAGTVIFNEGQPSDDIYVVESGHVNVQRETPFGTQILASVGKGSIFGEMNFIDRLSRSADAVVLEDCSIIRVSHEALNEVFAAEPTLALAVLREFWQGLAMKVREANELMKAFFADSTSGGPPGAKARESTDGNKVGVGESDVSDVLHEQGLTAEELRRLATYAEARSFPAEAAVFQEGDPGTALFVVLGGRVRISKHIPGVGEEALAILDRGDFFGEMALIDGSPRSASAISHVPDTQVLRIDRDHLEDLLAEGGRAARELLSILCRLLSSRLREINDRIIQWRMMSGGFQ
ncbi:MAG: cyclic nucleotide-binding domain-containing protein [Acidobacteriota bacterium]